jgi:hypothetical protein
MGCSAIGNSHVRRVLIMKFLGRPVWFTLVLLFLTFIDRLAVCLNMYRHIVV